MQAPPGHLKLNPYSAELRGMHTMCNLLIVWIATCAGLAANPAGDAVPLVFIANRGQAPEAVRFMAKGSALTAFFSSEEALFRIEDAFVRVQFLGARPAVEVEGLEPQPGQANFLIGPREEWRLGVPLYGGVIYRELYPGIDMVYGGLRQELKSEFIVAPGADPSQIRLRYVGASDMRIEDNGALVVPVNGELREQAPILYQERDGHRVAVDGRFALAAGGIVSFIVNEYDAGRPLIVDPVLSYSTLLGGSSSNAATALAVDASGSAYVAGFTTSYNFPTANPEQNFNAGGNDVFVAKLTPSGNGLAYCTYLGGKADDRAYGIAVDASGSAYVTGSTASSNFPVVNALQSKLAGGKNAFVAKLNPAGNSLVYSTFLGGSASDTGNGIAVDSGGNAYVVGDTTSLNFPAGGMQKGNGGGQDAFVAKIGANGSTLVYGSYLGGANDDHGAAIAVDAGGTAYVTGSTWSTNFPVANAWQGANGGGQDAFVARFSADGNSLLFSTYLGGSGGSLGYPESGQGMALDGQGNAYIAGATSSSNFPVLNAFDSFLSGASDAFVTKLTASGVPVYSTYLGGTGIDTANAIAVDANSNAYVVGQTFSSDLPVVNAFQAAYGGDYDAFAARLSPAGALVWLSYLGGSGPDTATAVALDPAADVYIAGWTLSPNFPVLNAYQSTVAGNYGAFVAKVPSGAAGAPPAAVGVTPNSGSGVSQTFSFQFSDSLGASDLTTVSVLLNSGTSTANACSVTYTLTANTLMLLTDAGAAPGGTITPGSGSQQNSQCVLNGAGSSVSLAGNILTLNLAISFQAAFAGSRNVYLQAVNPFGSIGWQLEGSWTVTVGPPAPVSVTPNSGSGSSQIFSFVFSSPRGYAALSAVLVVINTTQVSAGECYFVYYPGGNVFYLVNDTGSGWAGSIALGQSGTLQNSQCGINAAASTSSGSGNNLTLNIALTFSQAYNGAKNIYMDAFDGADSGWQQKGAWTVPGASGPPAPVSVSPSSGSGSSQTFSFVSSDPRGYAALSAVLVVVNATLASAGECYFLFYPGSNVLYLVNDAGSGWAGSIALGQSGTLQNSQCTINAAASSVSGSGNNLTLNVALTFPQAFGGAKNIYMDAYDGADSGWQQKGAWTVPGTGPPAPVSVMPSSGSGSSQTFAFVSSSPRGYAALSAVQVVINTTQASAGECYFLFYPGSNVFYLVNDTGSGWAGSIALGQSGTLQNSQCSINAAVSSSSGSGNNLTLNVALTFQPSYSGAKNIYMDVYDGIDSGWQQKGTWTVPGPTGPPAPVSVTPNSGSGSSQMFAFLSSSPRGYAALSAILVVINTTQVSAGECYFVFYPGSNVFYLVNDASSGWAGSITLGQSGTLQNSQCSINAAASSVSGSGNNLTLNVALTFKPSYSGAKNIYMDAFDGTDSGWQQKGTWTIP